MTPTARCGRSDPHGTHTGGPGSGIYCVGNLNVITAVEAHVHTVRTERVRGFQPPWYTVRVYSCPDGTLAARLRVNWHGPTPRGSIVGNCGHLVTI